MPNVHVCKYEPKFMHIFIYNSLLNTLMLRINWPGAYLCLAVCACFWRWTGLYLWYRRQIVTVDYFLRSTCVQVLQNHQFFRWCWVPMVSSCSKTLYPKECKSMGRTSLIFRALHSHMRKRSFFIVMHRAWMKCLCCLLSKFLTCCKPDLLHAWLVARLTCCTPDLLHNWHNWLVARLQRISTWQKVSQRHWWAKEHGDVSHVYCCIQPYSWYKCYGICLWFTLAAPDDASAIRVPVTILEE